MKKLFLLLLFFSGLVVKSQVTYAPLLEYHYIMSNYLNGTYNNGVKIVTQIPFDQEHMPVIKIDGYNMETKTVFGLKIGWYGDGSSFINPAASSTGQVIPAQIKLAEENGYVVIWFPYSGADTRFTISVYGEGKSEDPTWFEDWNVVDEDLTGSYITDVIVSNKFNDVEAKDITAQNMYPTNLAASYSSLGDATGYRLKLSGSSSYAYSESLRSGWGVFESRLDVTHSNQPALFLSRTLNTSGDGQLYMNGGFLTIAIAGNNGSWGIGTPGDVIIAKDGGGGGSFKFNTNVDYKFYTSGVERVKLSSNGDFSVSGRVFIGTVDPNLAGSHLLAVNGSAVFTKVKVRLYGSGWPDYVFEPGYKLRPLSMVEDFIKKYKHLPDVPPAEKIESDGVDVGETQAILLRKVEELTLYLIEQNRQNVRQQKTIDELMAKVKILEKQPGQKQ